MSPRVNPRQHEKANALRAAIASLRDAEVRGEDRQGEPHTAERSRRRLRRKLRELESGG